MGSLFWRRQSIGRSMTVTCTRRPRFLLLLRVILSSPDCAVGSRNVSKRVGRQHDGLILLLLQIVEPSNDTTVEKCEYKATAHWPELASVHIAQPLPHVLDETAAIAASG
jgi:hypothetical protein